MISAMDRIRKVHRSADDIGALSLFCICTFMFFVYKQLYNYCVDILLCCDIIRPSFNHVDTVLDL